MNKLNISSHFSSFQEPKMCQFELETVSRFVVITDINLYKDLKDSNILENCSLYYHGQTGAPKIEISGNQPAGYHDHHRNRYEQYPFRLSNDERRRVICLLKTELTKHYGEGCATSFARLLSQ